MLASGKLHKHLWSISMWHTPYRSHSSLGQSCQVNILDSSLLGRVEGRKKILTVTLVCEGLLQSNEEMIGTYCDSECRDPTPEAQVSFKLRAWSHFLFELAQRSCSGVSSPFFHDLSPSAHSLPHQSPGTYSPTHCCLPIPACMEDSIALHLQLRIQANHSCLLRLFIF